MRKPPRYEPTPADLGVELGQLDVRVGDLLAWTMAMLASCSTDEEWRALYPPRARLMNLLREGGLTVCEERFPEGTGMHDWIATAVHILASERLPTGQRPVTPLRRRPRRRKR